MMRRFFAFFSLILVATPVFARLAPELIIPKESNVILVTLDGIRWQEFFGKPDPTLAAGDTADTLPVFWSQLAAEGVVIGNIDLGSRMTVSNPAIMSLPAYQSIMAGSPQPCGNNLCGRISTETLQERLVRDLHLERNSVASIASWQAIPNAVEKTVGSHFVNAGLEPLALEGHEDLNQAQAANPPAWGKARLDRYTWEHAALYLKQLRPRFLYISLNDADEWGHRGSYPNYLKTIRQYDSWIRELTSQLNEMGDYGRRTTLLVTTDHGRGDGKKWTDHGSDTPEAGLVWMYARGPSTQARGVLKEGRAFAHAEIRATTEALLGICPFKCVGCGGVIPEIAQLPSGCAR